MVKNLSRLLIVQAVDIDVGHSGIATFGLANGPAHHFDTAKSMIGGKVDDFFIGFFGQNGTDKSKLHGNLLNGSPGGHTR